MIIEKHTKQKSIKHTPDSSKKDYLVFAIGFILVLLSNFSDLNKNVVTETTVLQEEKNAEDQTALLKSFSSQIKGEL